jgi:hypothetical protein
MKSPDSSIVYENILQLIEDNPNIQDDPCKIRLINWPFGFGSALTIFLNNTVYLKELNNDIMTEPIWNRNSKNFKYHDPSLSNSFYEYFTDRHHDRFQINNIKTYTAKSTPHKWMKTRWSWEDKHIQYFRDNYDLSEDIKEQVYEFLDEYQRPIYGIHLRSNIQKKKHFADRVCDVRETCCTLLEKHKNEECLFFIATDTNSYLDIAKSVFKNKAIYYKNFFRILDDRSDSVSSIKERPSLRFGYEILKDAYTLSLCDVFYYSPSNVHFLVRLFSDVKTIDYTDKMHNGVN